MSTSTTNPHENTESDQEVSEMTETISGPETVAKVVPIRPGTEVEPKVFDGEIVTDAESAELDRRMVADRVRGTADVAVRILRESDISVRVRSVVAYRVRKSPRDSARLTWFAIRGLGRWTAKAWTWATHGDLRADARNARLANDPEARRFAQETLRADAAARWAKLRSALKVMAIIAAGVLFLVVVDHAFERDQMWNWLSTVYGVLDIVRAVLKWMLWFSPLGILLAAIWEGRDKAPGAGFLVRPDRDDADSWVDERMISTALANLGVAPLDKFFKNGGQLVYSVPARVDGDGTYAQVRLPMGVTADMVAAQRKKLAANLGRAALETWPTEGDESGILDLWVADKGKLGGGAGEWPLQHDGQVDVFEGVPFGLTQRGAVINAMLFESNWLIGGRPGQGKSAAMRTLLLGACLDPSTEHWVYVMGESPDFEPFRPRLARYAMGMDDSVAESALQALRDLLAEMERRGKVLGEQPGRPPKTSRKLADKRALGLHLLCCWIDEVHELFMHPKYGKEAAELAVRLIKRGRKYGIVLVLATQSPTKESIPREVTRNVSTGIAFSVADHVANDGLLGAGKYKAGIRATDLRTKVDRGTCVAVGINDNVFELVRSFYVPFEDGLDMVSPVIARAMALMEESGRTVTPTAEVESTPVVVDHLADIAAVLGADKRVRTQTVLSRLAEKDAATYEGWTFADLKAALGDHDVEVVKSDGVKVVRADDVTKALTERDRFADDDDDADDGA
ncbi:FtsK/SpoIIIE domain-containing protein [Lentzea aerocolonigenes]|uniref:FtsK/SpoIIIE domain-containing protein n=1 Tax=Lentzea aerocolonigenes TaxID=68170 RepID=UPI0007C4AE51|nr:FtsK/SpoIIIE domain-containing protein [Lentzea aerocolonigenes]MCP2247724.1 DNA segregation ATPase FtsK/SpoIIIE, S-DNA-T family [Lentzea aerocolonigenes]